MSWISRGCSSSRSYIELLLAESVPCPEKAVEAIDAGQKGFGRSSCLEGPGVAFRLGGIPGIRIPDIGCM